MNDKMKTPISIIAIACLCVCMTPTEHLPSQPTPTPEENAKLAKQNWKEWIELTSQEWDAIIQQLSDRELYYVGGGMLTSTDILDLQSGISPYPPRITTELRAAIHKYARRKAEAEMTRRGISTDLPPRRVLEDRKPLPIPPIREPTDEEQMERIDHTFPRRFWGIDPPNPSMHTNYTDEIYFSDLVSIFSLLELKEFLKENASKMNDNEILITEHQIKDMEKGEWFKSHMTDYLKQLYEESRKATHKQNEE